MKKKALFLSKYLLLIGMIIFSCLSFFAFAAEEYLTYENFSYEIDNGQVTLYCPETELYESVTVPSEIDGYPVTTLGYGAFLNGQISAVTLPQGITTIGDFAFGGCYFIPEINLPSSVTSIGKYSFNSCLKLTGINLSESLETIGDYAFYYCGALESIVIPDSVTYIGRNAFSKCDRLKSVTLPKGIKIIDKFTFNDCDLRSIDLPDTLETIKKKAFYNCDNLKSVTVPESVTSIGKYAFGSSDQLKEIYILNPECKIYKGIVKSGATVYGYKNSTAEQYATANNNPFIDIETVETTVPAEKPSTVPETTDINETTDAPDNIPSSEKPQTTNKDEEPTTSKTDPLTVKIPSKIKIKPVRVKGTKAVVSWKTDKNADGYEISYSTTKKFRKKNTVVKKIKKAKAKKFTLKKLKKGKRYYIRIRAYKIIKGHRNSTLYGKYSKIKTVKIKR